MTLPMFVRAARSVRNRLGMSSTFQGVVGVMVGVEHGVEIGGYQDDQIIQRSVCTVPLSMNPKHDDVLIHPDGTYKLDAKIANNGANERWTLKDYQPPVV